MTQKLENRQITSGSILAKRFLIGGLLGWIIERIYRGKPNFGFLNIPFLPIYGLGAVLSGCFKGSPLFFLISVIMAETIGLTIDPTLWNYESEKVRVGPACSGKHLLYFLLLSICFEYVVSSIQIQSDR